ELGPGDLEPLDLDQLLDPVDDEQVAFGVEAGDVAGVQPAARVDGRSSRGRVAEVAGHQRGAGPRHHRGPRPPRDQSVAARPAAAHREKPWVPGEDVNSRENLRI